ncbi:hypothetical protein XBJ1_2268 [Xenorhabdus bovienii SS-2004]|uniref:Uncharacterized protein n=1 Tax=Xenorhabdus bovienii (strain SS-2004) TaxID=406818 RepID=D3V244_XENBS|nr:hypothetical protein XBJ1_2268 [Xenorhabdus bovienii SS-2004]
MVKAAFLLEGGFLLLLLVKKSYKDITWNSHKINIQLILI